MNQGSTNIQAVHYELGDWQRARLVGEVQRRGARRTVDEGLEELAHHEANVGSCEQEEERRDQE
jgi:hypothetical protein